jgi:hypothetical protein
MFSQGPGQRVIHKCSTAPFCAFNRASLYPLLGDPESARGGVTARRILSCLQEQLPTIAEPGMTFMQDDSPTHTARIVQRWLRNWLQENGLEILNWPPYSPDLDPIENLWKTAKREDLRGVIPKALRHAEER